MFNNFFKKIEAPVKNEETPDGSVLVDNSYTQNAENLEKIDYTALLDESAIEWKREEVEEAKNKFELIKDTLPEDFISKSYEERMEIVSSLIENKE